MSADVVRLSLCDYVLAGILFLFAVLVYLPRVAATVQPSDGGEIATAIVLNKIIHPPGYPLYSIIASALFKVAEAITPTFPPYQLLGFFSALAQAIAGSLLYFCIRMLKGDALVAFALSASWLLLWPTVFTATDVEVFSLHHVVLLLALLSLLRLSPDAVWSFVWCGSTIGLAIAHHHTIVLWAPFTLLLLGRALIKSKSRWMMAIAFIVSSAAPLLLYLHLMTRESFGFNRPESLLDLLNYFLRMSYGSFSLVANSDGQVWQGAEVFQVMLNGAPMYLVAVVLLVVDTARSRSILSVAFLVSLATHLWFIAKLQLPFDETMNYEWIGRFFPLICLYFALVLGYLSPRINRYVVVATLVVPLCFTVREALERGDAFTDRSVQAELVSALEGMPPHAVILAGADRLAMGLIYVTEVELLRFDVRVAAYSLLSDPQYQQNFIKNFQENSSSYLTLSELITVLHKREVPLYATLDVTVPTPYLAVIYGMASKIVQKGEYPTIDEGYEQLLSVCRKLPQQLETINEKRGHGSYIRTHLFAGVFETFVEDFPLYPGANLFRLVARLISSGRIAQARSVCMKTHY